MSDYTQVTERMQRLTERIISLLKAVDSAKIRLANAFDHVKAHNPLPAKAGVRTHTLPLSVSIPIGLFASLFSAYAVCLFHYMRTADGVEAYFTDPSLSLLTDVFAAQRPLFMILLVCFFPVIVASLHLGTLGEPICWITALPMAFNMEVTLSMEHSELREMFLPAPSALSALAINLGAVFAFMCVIAPCVSWLFYLFDHPRNPMPPPCSARTQYILAAVAGAIMFLGWLPGMLMCYPGTFPKDTLNQIRGFMGDAPMDTAHPIVQTVIYGWLFSLGRNYGNDNASIFKIILFHDIANAIVMGTVAARNYKYTKSIPLYVLTILFFGFTPTWCFAAQQALKDVFHTTWHLLFLLTFLECLRKKKVSNLRIAWLCFCGVMLSFTRKATFYLAVISLIVLLLKLRKTSWKPLTASILVVVVLFYGCEKVLYPALNFEKAREVENYSMQVQQVALYCREYGDELTEDELRVINGTLNYEKCLTDYTPMISDPIKKTFHGNAAAHEEFWALYSKMIRRHPLVFLKSMIMTSFEHFNPWFDGNNDRRQLHIQKHDFHNVTFRDVDAMHDFFDYMVSWSKVPVARLMNGTGLSIWVLLALTGYAIRKKSTVCLLGLSPHLFLFVGMFMTHVNGLARYGYPLIAGMPLIIGFTIFTASPLRITVPPVEFELKAAAHPAHLQWLDTFGTEEDESDYFAT